MSLYSTEKGDHLGIIIFSSILLILLNSLISLWELYKTLNVPRYATVPLCQRGTLRLEKPLMQTKIIKFNNTLD